MISCQNCGEPGTVSNKFCSQCGWTIDPTDLQAAVTQSSKDVADGQRLFGENRITEAYALALSVLMVDPDNVPALALKGDCLERKGDIEGALAAYENVVTLKPDSPLDRIRVVQLRRLAITPQDIVQDRPARRYNLLAGIAAFALLTSAGSAIVLASKKEGLPVETTKPEITAKSAPFLSPAPVPTQPKTTSSVQPGNNDLPIEPTDKVEERPNTNGSRRVTTGSGVPFAGTRLPNADPNGFQPVTPNIEVVRETGTTQDPDPVPVKPAEGKETPEKAGSAPIIDIRPSKPGNKTVGGSQVREDNGNEGTALIRSARQFFLAGEYEKAAKAYEKAIKLGASTASANHRLAQCYLNLRRRPEALSAYHKALTAYQQMFDGGVGDKRLVETYIDECRTAIKLLQ